MIPNTVNISVSKWLYQEMFGGGASPNYDGNERQTNQRTGTTH